MQIIWFCKFYILLINTNKIKPVKISQLQHIRDQVPAGLKEHWPKPHGTGLTQMSMCSLLTLDYQLYFPTGKGLLLCLTVCWTLMEELEFVR